MRVMPKLGLPECRVTLQTRHQRKSGMDSGRGRVLGQLLVSMAVGPVVKKSPS